MKVLVIEIPWGKEPVEVPWDEDAQEFYELTSDVELLESGETLFIDNVAYSLQEKEEEVE